MNVSLTPYFEKMIRDLVESGRYSSSSEVVRAAMRLMQQHEADRKARLRELRREIDIGIKASREGRVRVFDATTARRIKARGRQLLRQRTARRKAA